MAPIKAGSLSPGCPINDAPPLGDVTPWKAYCQAPGTVYEQGLPFKDPMTTAAAIDRLVHHSVILELNLPSYRLEASKRQIVTAQQPVD